MLPSNPRLSSDGFSSFLITQNPRCRVKERNSDVTPTVLIQGPQCWLIFSRCGTTLASMSLPGPRCPDSRQWAFSCSVVLPWRVSPQLLCFGKARYLIVLGLSIQRPTSNSLLCAARSAFFSCSSLSPSSRQESVGSDADFGHGDLRS
jgi:hypothetical protein